MIINFSCQETEKIWQGYQSLLPRNMQQVARRKLRMMNNAKQLADLRIPPNNRLEALKGDHKGKLSIRINKQWRICFKWINVHCHDVIIEDYN